MYILHLVLKMTLLLTGHTERTAIGLIHLHSLRAAIRSMVVFYYYLLGGNTAMPGELYAGLCHAFLVLFNKNVQNNTILK